MHDREWKESDALIAKQKYYILYIMCQINDQSRCLRRHRTSCDNEDEDVWEGFEQMDLRPPQAESQQNKIEEWRCGLESSVGAVPVAEGSPTNLTYASPPKWM